MAEPDPFVDCKDAPATSGEVAAAGMPLRCPPFYPEEPEVWSAQLEGQFILSRISSDTTKNYFAAAQLEAKYAIQVRDILTNPPEADKYEKLKAELISRLSASQEKRIQLLLLHEELGDRKPSQFLRHLQNFAGPSGATKFVKSIWTNRLPQNIQTVIASQIADLLVKKLAEIADRVYEIALMTPQVASTSAATTADSSDLAKQVCELQRQVALLTTRLNNLSRQRSRSRPRDNHRRRFSGLASFILAAIQSLNFKYKFCYVNFKDVRSHVKQTTDLKMIYFVTPTYPRPQQVPELTRLAHTLMHVPRLHWIIADDQSDCSGPVHDILRRSGLPYTYIANIKPYMISKINSEVSNRIASLQWLRKNVHEGILYFGDDDNTYDLRLFEEIRNTKKVSMFPVGLIGKYGVSTPIVKDQKVVAFFDSWWCFRKFPVDMAGFAVNIEYLKPSVSMRYTSGFIESNFLIDLGIKMDEIEPLAANCSKVLVWHTRSTTNKKQTLKINLEKINNSPKYENFVYLLKEIFRLGMVDLSSYEGIETRIIRNFKQYETANGLL